MELSGAINNRQETKGERRTPIASPTRRANSSVASPSNAARGIIATKEQQKTTVAFCPEKCMAQEIWPTKRTCQLPHLAPDKLHGHARG